MGFRFWGLGFRVLFLGFRLQRVSLGLAKFGSGSSRSIWDVELTG